MIGFCRIQTDTIITFSILVGIPQGKSVTGWIFFRLELSIFQILRTIRLCFHIICNDLIFLLWLLLRPARLKFFTAGFEPLRKILQINRHFCLCPCRTELPSAESGLFLGCCTTHLPLERTQEVVRRRQISVTILQADFHFLTTVRRERHAIELHHD